MAAYPINWNIDIAVKYISNYDWFCDEFLKTGRCHDNEFISEQLGCKIHYSKNMDLKQICDNLKHSDVVLVRLKCWEFHKKMKYYNRYLSSIINKPFKLIGFNQVIESDFVSDQYSIYKMDINSMIFTNGNQQYVKGWDLSEHDIQVLENVWNDIKQFA